MMLNIMALVFGRLPEHAPFFIKPLLRAISKKAEQGNFTLYFSSNCSVLRTTIKDAHRIHRK